MKFAADAMLGKLAKWLRILGYDTTYERAVDDKDLVRDARAGGRLILTRDTGLIKRLEPDEYLFIRDNAPIDQLAQAVSELGLEIEGEGLLRLCTLCNARLEPSKKESVAGSVPEYTFERQKDFYRCPSCGRVYWPGTHAKRIACRLKRVAGRGK
jgi:uncharacterized protein with PIN domain